MKSDEAILNEAVNGVKFKEVKESLILMSALKPVFDNSQ